MAKTLHFYTVAGLNGALRGLPKTAAVKLRDASQAIAEKVAADAAAGASRQGGVAKHVAPTIRATRDRVPVVKMGGSGKLPNGGTVGDVIWGAEFGGGARPSTRQFDPWRGSGTGAGYFLFPAVRNDREFIEQTYGDAILEATDEAAAG